MKIILHFYSGLSWDVQCAVTLFYANLSSVLDMLHSGMSEQMFLSNFKNVHLEHLCIRRVD